MKRTIIFCYLAISVPVLAGYTYEVTDGLLSFGSLSDHESLLMTGGAGRTLILTEWSTATIMNTSPYSEDPVGGIRELDLMGHSHLDFYGGDVVGMGLGSYSTATLFGGKFQQIYSSQIVSVVGRDPITGESIYNHHIEMVVRDWLYNAANKRLTGTWEDFSKFNIKLIDVQSYSPTIENIQFTIIPEPLTLTLLALGGTMIRRR